MRDEGFHTVMALEFRASRSTSRENARDMVFVAPANGCDCWALVSMTDGRCVKRTPDAWGIPRSETVDVW
jgi:hypothetical protein